MEKTDGLNEYEKIRNRRVAQNQAKLKEFGVLNIARSFASLGESSKNIKRKEKNDADKSKDGDNEYIPNLDEETNEDVDVLNSEIIRRKVTRSGGRRQVQYIPPRSMSRYPNFGVQGLGLNRSDISSNDRHIEDRPTKERQNSQVASLRLKNNGNKMTMADVILQKQKTQAGNKHVSSSETQTQTACKKNKMFQVDPQHLMEHMSSECQSHSKHHDDIHIFDHIGERLSDYNDEASNDYSDEDLNQVLELEHSDTQLESEEDIALIEDEQLALDHVGLEPNAILKVKTRGPTMLHHVHMRSLEKRKAIFLNEFGQPIGPITEEEDTVAEFSRFLGTIARDYGYAPLIFNSWRQVPNKDKMWDYVLMKYIVPEEGKDWVIKTIATAWRLHKCRFKKKHYYSYKDDKTRWQNRSKRVPDQDFAKLLATWKKQSEKARCSRNRNHRLSQKNGHTVGPKSFAVIREEMRKQHPNKEPPTLAELFERTRKRTDGRAYKESFEDTSKKIEDMKNYIPPVDGTGPTEPFLGVMGNGYDGCLRLYGRGVCKKKLKKVNGETSYMVPGELVESLKVGLYEEMQKDMDSQFRRLEDMRREIEEENSKKKEEIENKQRDLDNEREIMTEQILQKILQKLPTDVARKYLF